MSGPPPAGAAVPGIRGPNVASQGPASGQPQSASQQNLNQIVIEYLNKKGYSRTEATLRQESANIDAHGRVVVARAEDRGGHQYLVAYRLLNDWIKDNLEVYKAELQRLRWPVFVYSFLQLVIESHPELAKRFFDENSGQFIRERADDLRAFEFIAHDDHIDGNATAKNYRDNRYRLTLTHAAFYSVISFLESKEKEGGSVIIKLFQKRMNIVTVDRAAGGVERGFAAMLAKRIEEDIPEEDEGIPGHNPGSANTDPNAPPVLTRLTLGALPMDTDLLEDVRDELEEEDAKDPPGAGQNSLVEELDQKIKREPSEDAPNRESIPLPPSLARDVAMEVLSIKEHRDRLKIEPRSGGVGPGVSVTMFTFHNTFDSINCIDFSGDNTLVAAGTSESYIRVWSLEGKALPSIITPSSDPSIPNVSSSRRLIGHAGPVYAVSFSPSIAGSSASISPTTSRCLLSASEDKTVRLWSLDAWACLVVYKGHDQPVWDVTWGPFGHYFLTGSHDRTARLWSTDHIAPLRIFAGHDQDVDHVTFHPNNAYVFTGSSDKTVRMWDVSRGSAVRIFTGHTANITALACAPNGKTLASADDAGAIFLWDLSSGRRIKRMRGHGKGGIWSLSWSVESSLLVSGGADATVRVWDPLQQTEGSSIPAKEAEMNGGIAGNVGGSISGPSGGGPGGGGSATAGVASAAGKKAMPKAKDAAVTADQISAFPTKKTPVYRVVFTRMNLVLAGGAYLP